MSNKTNSEIKMLIEEARLQKSATSDAVVSTTEITDSNDELAGQNTSADEERAPEPKENKVRKTDKKKQQKKEVEEPAIFKRIKEYDHGDGTFMLHVQVNEKTYNLAKQLNAATKVTTTKLLGFAVAELFNQNPELEEAIKKHIKKTMQL
jgi:hypothetical protein